VAIEIITKEDLEEFRIRLLADIKAMLPGERQPPKQWLRSNEVMKMLGISMGTLQNLSISRILHPSKVGGLNYYKYEEIESVLKEKSNKKDPQ
jgi:hypothetical protein